MSVRWDDAARTVTVSVRDLVQLGGRKGHVVRSTLLGPQRRMALGTETHADVAAERADADASYRAEVRLVAEVDVPTPGGTWRARVVGRVDGLLEAEGRTCVEEVKTTALAASRLYRCDLSSFTEFVAQLEGYLWILCRQGHERPFGRLVLVSIVDGARHLLGVNADDLSWVDRALRWMVLQRDRRHQWLNRRLSWTVPWPFEERRAGQVAISEAVRRGLRDRQPVLIEAPTGAGKTAAVMVAALQAAFETRRQIYWATARTTQQRGVEATVDRIAALGLPLRRLTVGSRARACVNDRVSCHPDRCRFATSYLDKVRDGDLLGHHADGRRSLADLRVLGETAEVCPHEFGFELASVADVVIGDYHHVFEAPHRALGDDPNDWIVIVDEAHQLVPRARRDASPVVDAAQVHAARRVLARGGSRLAAFTEILQEIDEQLAGVHALVQGPIVAGEARATPSPRVWRELADRVESLAIDWAVLGGEARDPTPQLSLGDSPPEAPDAARSEPTEATGDPWLTLGRAVQRLADGLADRPETRVPYVRVDPTNAAIGLIELDPSAQLGALIAQVGGYVGVSATLQPFDVERRLCGVSTEIPARLDVSLPSPFPPERRRVLIVPRVSTRYADRATQAAPTAAILERLIQATPGNVAVFFSSFEVLADLTGRWSPGRRLLAQRPGMSDEERAEMLDALTSGPPVVLAAVLGGIFAEGIDLPPGALRAVIVCGPAFPPPSLELTLLHAYHEQHDGDGFYLASLIPGLRRVVQAAGRLIRREQDRGIIALVDARFRWRQVRELLPSDWEPAVPDDPVAAFRAFFAAEYK
jgi:DNA excision repair protein ERCC-2